MLYLYGGLPPAGRSDGAWLLPSFVRTTILYKGGGRNDRLRTTVVGHYDRHACTGCNELQQGRQIEKRAAIQRELVGGSISVTEGRSSTAASSLPALLLYHLHEVPSSPFAANNAFVRHNELPQGRQTEKRAAIQRELFGGSNPYGGEKLCSSVIPSCSFIIPSPSSPRLCSQFIH